MAVMGKSLQVSPELLSKYDRPGPRYTSYPTAPVWHEEFGDAEYRAALRAAAQRPDEPLSLYIHIPFCHERCAFCGCNVIISRKEGVEDRYLDYVERELDMAAAELGGRRNLMQMHWGGGTPTFLNVTNIRRLHKAVADRFAILPGAELALEVDPRVTTQEQLATLRELGFNRISMGVQDLDPLVQCEIHRYQTEAQTRQMYTWCRDAGFGGINMDLIYGLPGQHLDSWSLTIRKIVEIGPDRVAVYSYAYLPERLHNQRHIDATKLPGATEKFELLAAARDIFIESGYRAIGMDHFAKPHDELSIAVDERRLRRNFMGYTVVPATDMLGVGASAIGEIGGAYAQNEKKLSRYYEAIGSGQFATSCGCVLSRDDMIRSHVIRELMCNFHLDKKDVGRRFDLEFSTYFAAEEAALAPFVEDGFLTSSPEEIVVEPLGQVFVRNIAMVFDAYLRSGSVMPQFSRTV